MTAVSALGTHSGAPLNPVMTLAFLIEGKISASHAAWYVVSQFLGGHAKHAWSSSGTQGQTLDVCGHDTCAGSPPRAPVALEALSTVTLVGTVFVSRVAIACGGSPRGR